MNNKGFVMIETIIVMSVLAIGLIALYSSYNIILNKAATSNNYDEPEDIYKVNMIDRFLSDNSFPSIVDSGSYYIEISFDNSGGNVSCQSFKFKSGSILNIKTEESDFCKSLSIYNVDKIFYFYNYDKTKNITYLDGYVIDYVNTIMKNGFDTGIVVKFKNLSGRTSLASLNLKK